MDCQFKTTITDKIDFNWWQGWEISATFADQLNTVIGAIGGPGWGDAL